MKYIKRDFTLLLILIWRFFSAFTIYFYKSERIAKQKLSFLIICFSFAISFAQQYTNFSTKDGMPSNHVYTIVQDAKGFMWFLTDKGMVKYNGKTFKTITTKDGLPNNDVWDAFTTPDGKVWYFSKSTHLGYIENDSVLSFPSKKKDEIINPIYSYQINDSVYPADPNKTFRLKDNTWQNINIPNNKDGVEDFTKVIHSKVDYLSLNFNSNTLDVYGKNKEIIKQFSAKNIIHKTGVRGQINDSLFFWTSNKLYTILNLNSLVLKSRSFKNEIGIDSVKHPRINLAGKTVQITGDRFVGMLDKEFHVLKPFYFPKQLNAHFGFIDSQNTIWLSTFNKGVYKLSYIKQNTTNAFEDEKIQKLNVIDNQLYASIFNKGFYKYNKEQKRFSPFIKSEDFIYGVTKIEALDKTFFFSKSNIFIKQKDKIHTFNFYKRSLNYQYLQSHLKTVTFFNSELYGIYSFGIYKLDNKTLNIKKEIIQKGCNDFLVFNSRLVIATISGLKELKNDSIINIKFKNQEFNKSIISIKTLSENQILINTDGYGSYISDLNTIIPIKATEYLIVQDAFIKDKSIWLATNTGVLHLEKTNNTFKLIRNYTINDGLPNNNVNTVFVDNEDLIVGTNNGLSILPINQERQDAFIDVFIENASFNGKKLTEENNTFNYQNDTNNTLRLEVNTINFSEDNSNSFSYKLEPLQKEWSVTTTNDITFNNLQPDSYVFSLESGNEKKQLSFIVKPLWWQTFWATLLFVLFSIALIAYVVWQIIKKSLQKKNKKLIQEKKLSEIQLKALRSQMNPHFVFNSLAAIQYYINNNEIEASEAYLVKFSKLIRQFFELSKETEISLNQEISLIKSYLEIEKLRFKEKFEFKIKVDSQLNKTITKLPTMLLQPIVENAVNHGVFNKIENSNISINFIYLSEKSIKVEIIDDGVGFINTKKKSNRKVKSSNVLEDRLKYLNQSELWSISYSDEELNPQLDDKGNRSTFVITQL